MVDNSEKIIKFLEENEEKGKVNDFFQEIIECLKSGNLLDKYPQDLVSICDLFSYKQENNLEILLKSLPIQQRVNIHEISKSQKDFKMNKLQMILTEDVITLIKNNLINGFKLSSLNFSYEEIQEQTKNLPEFKDIKRFQDDILDFKDPKYFEKLISLLPTNFKLNCKIYIPTHFHLSMIYPFYSNNYIDNIISDEIDDLNIKVKCQMIAHDVCFVSKDYLQEKEKRLKILFNYRKFLNHFMTKLKKLRNLMFIKLMKTKNNSQIVIIEWIKRLNTRIIKWRRILYYFKRDINKFKSNEHYIRSIEYNSIIPSYILNLMNPIPFVKLKLQSKEKDENIPNNLFTKNIPPDLCVKYLQNKDVNIQTEEEMIQELFEKWRTFLNENENEEYKGFYLETNKNWSRIFEPYSMNNYKEEVEMVNMYMEKIYVSDVNLFTLEIGI